MSRHPLRIDLGRPAILLLGVVLAGFVAQSACYADATTARMDNQADRAKSGAQIECITPDGRLSAVYHARTMGPRAPASIIDPDTISCPLQEGETTFIIALSKRALRDRLTFVNENAAACGELKIAVSNSRLPADSPKWTKVDGIVPFAHKRLFNLSMLGVETKFVRLSFHVESARDENAVDRHRGVARATNTFRSSALAGPSTRTSRMFTRSAGMC